MLLDDMTFPMPWADLYAAWADDRAEDDRIYGRCPHGDLNAVTALHYSLIEDHERTLEQAA